MMTKLDLEENENSKFIYRVKQDKTKMSCIKPVGKYKAEDLFFDATPRFDGDRENGKLETVQFELVDSCQTFNDILYLNDGVFVFGENLFESKFRWAISYVGELIEIEIKDTPQKYFIGNITHCMNIVDYERSRFSDKYVNGEREIFELYIKKERMSTGRSLMKLFDNASFAIYCLGNFCGLDFPTICTENNYDFISFEKIIEFNNDD